MSSDLTQWLNDEENGWKRVTLPHMVIGDSFVAGKPDDQRLQVRYFQDEGNRQLKGRVWFGPGTQGPPGHAHGGSIAAVLDEAMGGAAWLAGHTVVAAEITISYREMLPLETRCVIAARVVAVDGRKVRAEAEVKDHGGRVYATARGLFITLDQSKFREMAERFKELLQDPATSASAACESQEMEIDPEACLQPTDFIDAANPAIVTCVAALGIDTLPPPERARILFEFVRDEIRYEVALPVDAALPSAPPSRLAPMLPPPDSASARTVMSPRLPVLAVPPFGLSASQPPCPSCAEAA